MRRLIVWLWRVRGGGDDLQLRSLLYEDAGWSNERGMLLMMKDELNGRGGYNTQLSKDRVYHSILWCKISLLA